jgi:hypothetical protein
MPSPRSLDLKAGRVRLVVVATKETPIFISRKSDPHALKQTIASRSVAPVSSSNWSLHLLFFGFGCFIAPFAMMNAEVLGGGTQRFKDINTTLVPVNPLPAAAFWEANTAIVLEKTPFLSYYCYCSSSSHSSSPSSPFAFLPSLLWCCNCAPRCRNKQTMSFRAE